MTKNIYDKLKKIELEQCGVDVTKYKSDRVADNDRLIREFNRGKSFEFNEWKSLTKYSNDDFKQDFVTYNNALLACKRTHISENPPKLVYDSSNGVVIGVESPEWQFVFASGINYNEYYFDDLSEGMFGSGLVYRSDDNTIYATSDALTTEPIVVNVDLGTNFKKGDVIPAGTPVQDVLKSVFTSTRLGRSDGLSIYTTSMLEEMDDSDKPEQYISVRDDKELLNRENERTYLDILFSSIRSLQAEVAKMRNAFKYGMYSYTGQDTALSAISDDNTKEKDALWSVEESDLSEITTYAIDFEGTSFPFLPKTNVDVTKPGVVTFKDSAYWNDYMDELKSLEDPKLYLYMTTNSLNINISLFSAESTNQFVIDLGSVINTNAVKKYNIVTLVSRKHKGYDDEDYYGFNYIWISISNYENGRILAEGYYDVNSKRLVKNISYISERYYISAVTFNNLSLYKFNLYSKYQDFSEEVNPSTPSDSDYRYRVAHLTIRSIENYEKLEEIQSQLPNNELIWEEANRKLWIKTKDSLVAIGGTNINPSTGMTQTEVIELLQKMGIVYFDETDTLQLSGIGDATFINSDTGKQFKFAVSPEGDLVGTEIPEKTLAQRIKDVSNTNPISTEDSFRGFIARLLCAEDGKSASATSDVGLNSDRVKIGAVYCPLTTDTKFGCSHGYIELENTSDVDIPLEGIYLHYLHPINSGYKVDHLALKGILKAGSTYLIRCKKYADPTVNSDVVIKVEDYDQEWYIDGELLDLSNDGKSSYAFALTFGNSDATTTDASDGAEISQTTTFVVDANPDNDKQRYYWKWYFIDSLILNDHYGDSTSYWGINVAPTVVKSNSIVKNMFELDPAKQAFQSLTTIDSSRRRTEKPANDIQTLVLNDSKIEFPNSDETYPIDRFTPKASKFKKNVSTDKTPLDMEKPNMVNCAFGKNAYTTRCFNWISAGSFDEYVFIKNGNSWNAFESYTNVSTKNTQVSSFPNRKEFDVTVNNTIYARIHKKFPGCDINYTSHKCVINLVNSAVENPLTYTYIVGRMTKDGSPDFKHCSDEQTFTLYPESYVPRIYQITDQQGFHWIEYQVWAAAAKALNDRIVSDCKKEHIIPVLINTGDVTQNGTRINEWLDYHNAGKSLFTHLEQMNCVGNNDLCGTDPEVLGTGDDVGKSNSFYFHVFHCYEVDESEKIVPIIQTDTGENKYIPSLYYFDFKSHRIVIANSEITYVNCRDWFNKKINGDVVNVYTGWAVENSYSFKDDFTSIYTMMYNIFNSAGSKKIVVACHEMPFTVMVTDSLKTSTDVNRNWRSFSGTGTSLIGSHMNQLNATDKIGVYWFSRLLEYFGVKLCLGGHKHTYASTLPIRENYQYVDSDGKTVESKTAIMPMEETLANDDNVIWIVEEGTKNLTKYPLINSSQYNFETHSDTGYVHPYTLVEGLTGGVTYFMCQATGYKLTSNKELPSNYQEFSNLIPKTNGTKADNAQKEPMFAVIDPNGEGYTIKLVKAKNIFDSAYKFSQTDYAKDPVYFHYATPVSGSRYCDWTTTETNIITV